MTWDSLFMLPDQALQQVVEGCGTAFRPCIGPELRTLLLRTLLHPNRFARETAYHVLAALFGLCGGAGELLEWGGAAAERLQDGLSENWSQVRRWDASILALVKRAWPLASCEKAGTVATRTISQPAAGESFLQILFAEHAPTVLWRDRADVRPCLVPHMCSR